MLDHPSHSLHLLAAPSCCSSSSLQLDSKTLQLYPGLVHLIYLSFYLLWPLNVPAVGSLKFDLLSFVSMQQKKTWLFFSVV